MNDPTSSHPRPQPVNVVDLVLWVVAWLLVAGVVWSSLGPPPSALADLSFGDKLLHFGAYAATTGAFLLAAVWRPGRGDGLLPRAAPLLVAAAIVIAVGLEVAQGTLAADRTADVFDAMAGSLGAAVALVGWSALRRALGSRPAT